MELPLPVRRGRDREIAGGWARAMVARALLHDAPMTKLVAVCAIGLVFAASLSAACATDPADSEPAAPHVAESMTVEASDATKSELGIVVWGADGEAGALHVTGYASDGSAAYVVDQRRVMIDETHHAFETTLGGPRESARMRLSANLGQVDASGHFQIALEVTDNTFAASPNATSVLAHLEKDFTTAASAPAAGSSLLSPRDLDPLAGTELVKGCSPLLKQCAGSLYRAGAPLVPCATALVQAGGILLCGVAGFFAGGPMGALEAGAICGLRSQGAVVNSTMKCIDSASDVYNNWKSRQSDVMSSCKSAATSCTGSGTGAAMASRRFTDR